MDEDEFDEVLEDVDKVVEEFDPSDPQQAFLIVERNFNKVFKQ